MPCLTSASGCGPSLWPTSMRSRGVSRSGSATTPIHVGKSKVPAPHLKCRHQLKTATLQLAAPSPSKPAGANASSKTRKPHVAATMPPRVERLGRDGRRQQAAARAAGSFHSRGMLLPPSPPASHPAPECARPPALPGPSYPPSRPPTPEGGTNQRRHYMPSDANDIYHFMVIHLLPKPVGTL